MPARTIPRTSAPRTRSKRSQRSTWQRFWKNVKVLPSARTRRRWWRAFRAGPLPAQFMIGVLGLLTLWFITNGLYQVARKPTELFFPVSGTLYKTPTETWDEYGAVFKRHATATMTAPLLAALAQVEGSGNPIVRTYWRWAWRPQPFEMYRPASSAVGMYQITDGTFAESSRYCIHDHVVVEDGAWDDWDSCWFTSLYFRVVPSDAVELTAAYLDRNVEYAMKRFGVKSAALSKRQDLAAVIHLCGAGAGAAYVRRGFRFAPGQKCGDHLARAYVSRVNTMKKVFAALAAHDD